MTSLEARREIEEPPLGDEDGGHTRVVLPEAIRLRFRNVLTDERVSAAIGPADVTLAAGEVFASFPLALLERES